MGKNPAVISDAGVSTDQKEISLRIDVYKNPPAAPPGRLPNHPYLPQARQAIKIQSYNRYVIADL